MQGRAMGHTEASSSSSWRFSMELLSHVHTLRVFLFNSSPHVKPDQDCVRLEATLLCAPPALSCSWNSSHQACVYALRLPLPLLLFDYSAPPRISTLPDCIQLSLRLLPFPPFHLHAFSSLSLAPDGVHTHNPDGMHMPNSTDNSGVQHEAFCANNGTRGDDDSFHSSDGDKSSARDDDTHESGHAATCTSTVRGYCHHDGASEVDHDAGYAGDNIPKNAVHATDDVGHGNDGVHQSHEHAETRPIKSLASLGDNSMLGDVHQNHQHDGTHERGHIATPALNNHDCHCDCVREDDRAVNSIYLYDNFCSHEQPTQGPYHKDDLEAHGTHEITQDTATALNFPGCHNDGMSKVHADGFVHGDYNGVCVDKDAWKSHKHNYTSEVLHVANTASDISGCHHHDGMSEVDHVAIEAGADIHRVCLHAVHAHDNICSHDLSTHAFFQHHNDGIEARKHPTDFNDCSSSLNEDGAFEGCLKCQHGRNAADLSNYGSSLPAQYDDSTVLEGAEDQILQGATIFHCKKCSVKVSKNPVRNLVQLPCFDWRDIVENWFGACCCSFGSKAEILSANFEKSLTLRPGKCLVGSSTFYVNFSDVTVETKSVVLNTDSKISQWSTLHFLALGNGFMVWENQESKYFSWLPVYCTGCATLIGAYACKSADSGSIREGLHLFRCQITTFNADSTLYDTLKYATFKELLVKELRLRTEENTSYRFLIRSLTSQLPLLQLVVLNYDSLICTGNVTARMLDLGEHPQITSEATLLLGEARLQQSIKVLFLDCNGLSTNEIRLTERWVLDYDAETIFMLEEFVGILKRELLSNRVFYPAACGLSQVFHGSFIHMSHE